MEKAWIAALLLLAACQTERLSPGAPVALSAEQIAIVQGAVRNRLAGGSADARFSLLRAADAGAGRILVCGVVDAPAPGKPREPLPFRAGLSGADAATVLDLGGSRYRNEVIAARCGRSGISTQNLIILG